MAEEKEQLKIEATLDTSKLKRDAQQGMQTVVNEEKKVENQSRQTSRAVDNIGQAGRNVGRTLQQAGSQGTSALRQIGNEADRTAKKIGEINDSIKGIKIGQAIGFANNIVNSDTAKTIGKYAGKQMGMADDTMSFLGGYASAILGGASTGAGIGAMIGAPAAGVGAGVGAGIGAAAGALAGGASYLVKSAIELHDSSNSLKEAAQEISKNNANTVKEIDRAEKKSKTYQTISSLISEGEFDEAERLLGKEEKNARDRFKTADFRIRQGSTQALDEAFKEELANRTSAKADLSELSRLRGVLTGKREAQDRKYEQQQKSYDSFVEQVANSYFSDVAKWQNENRREELNNKLKENESLISRRQSLIDGMSSTKLTDSMVQMGAGGYGIQMQGINSYVRNMSSTLEALNRISENILTTIRSINDKYTPYSGEFI